METKSNDKFFVSQSALLRVHFRRFMEIHELNEEDALLLLAKLSSTLIRENKSKFETQKERKAVEDKFKQDLDMFLHPRKYK